MLSEERVRSYAKRKGLNRIIKLMIATDEQRQWIVDNQAGMSRRQLTTCFNNRFGTSFSISQLTSYCRRRGLKADEITRNRKPIGTVSRQGKFLCIKTANPDKWEVMHRVQWESYHGKKIPEGFMIVFADGDCDNLSRDNLVCVRDSIGIVINHRNRANTANPELNKVIMLSESLNAMVNDRERLNKECV
ncbi:HNH endonuclease [Psychrobacter sp. 16-MNA-CIBAN-0192]|uniref:HNH endonuclease n=1 Tax=Psychrobacter sp. 16-MNA-CIBAN-0192 TaxID=3140448 RepID=UPI00332277CD